MRPTDNVFSAKGGFSKYIFKADQEKLETEFREKLKDVYSGYNLSQYIHRIWFDKYIVDPNGLIFIEVSNYKDESGINIYPTYKSIFSIRNYKQDGINVDWVIFEPDETIFDDEVKQEGKAELFWVVDEVNYYRCSIKDDAVTIITTQPHSFGRVPAVLASDIEDHVTGWKRSPIDKQVELLDKFMVDNSVLNIVDFMHSYPQQWMYVDTCTKCSGTGEYNSGTRNREGDSSQTYLS